jgi:hypothetical protein
MGTRGGYRCGVVWCGATPGVLTACELGLWGLHAVLCSAFRVLQWRCHRTCVRGLHRHKDIFAFALLLPGTRVWCGVAYECSMLLLSWMLSLEQGVLSDALFCDSLCAECCHAVLRCAVLCVAAGVWLSSAVDPSQWPPQPIGIGHLCEGKLSLHANN